MINDLILRVTNNGVVTDLDVDGNVPLRLDVSQVINQEIGQVYGIASQNFNLPGTSKNNKFFNHAYLESAVDIPGFYNTIGCSVIRNGETLLQGQLQLIQVITNENGFTTYEVLITDSAVEFNAELGDKLLKDADFSRLDHTLTSGSIIESWTTPISGGVFYPVADYGADEFSVFPTEPIINLSGDSADSGSIDNPITPMAVYQFLPAIKVKEVISSICQQAGFNYTSSFIDSSDFDNIYMLTKAKEDLGIVGEVQQNTLTVSSSNTQDLTPNTGITQACSNPLQSSSLILFNEDVDDPGNAYDNTTGYYTPPYAGAYFLDIECQLDYEMIQGTVIVGLNFSEVGSGATNAVSRGGRVLLPGDPPADDTTTLALQNRVELDSTKQYEVRLYMQMCDFNDPFDVPNLYIQSGSSFSIPRALSIYDNADVNVALQFDSELKSIDVFKGILEHFNLVAYVEPGQNKIIKIEQVDDWLRSGDTKDWTEKYNTAKRRSINHTVDEQPKTLLFQQAEDSDRFSKLSQESEPNFQYGTLRTISDSNVTTGETEIGTTFAPVVLASAIQYGGVNFQGVATLSIGDSNFILPHLYKFENNERVSFKFKPRLGYKANTPVPPAANNQTIWIGNSGSAYGYSGSYATISNVNALPVVTGTSKDLHFNSTYPTYVPDSFNINSGSNNYTNNWQTYINSLYWDEAKKVTLDLYFDEYEYQDIKLNDKILIGDNTYRINKIKGFNLTRRDVVAVELLKDFPAYTLVIPSGSGTVCPTVSTYPAQNITSQSMLLTGSVDSEGTETVVERGFVVSDIAAFPEVGEIGATKYPTGSGVGHFDYPLTGLNAGTTYYYQAYASSSLCDVIYGGNQTATTLTSSACPEVETYDMFSFTTSSFGLSGSLTTTGSATIVEKGFVYSTSDTTPTVGEGATKVLVGPYTVGEYDTIVSGATCNTTYYARAYVSSSGCEDYGDTVSGSTSACPTACNAFSASGPTNFGGACSETISQVLYTDYSGSWPPTQAYLDGGGSLKVYTSAGCTVPSFNTYYAFDSGSATGTNVNAFLRVDDAAGDDPGDVIYIYDCTGP